jgi:short-subunit dehydrogenase
VFSGACSGIGAALAPALARRGHGVILVARRTQRLDDLAQEVARDHGVRAEVIGCDLAASPERARLRDQIAALGLTVEVLCNNAGFGTAAPFIKLDRERQLELLRVNCEAVVDLCAAYAPAMVERGRGAILNVASTAAFQPLPGQAVYAASKALVLSFTEALHQELGGKGVAVTALCPGPVKTEFAEVGGFADVESSTPSFVWSTAESAAEAGVRGLEAGRRVVIPGALNRAGAISGHHTPRALLLRAVARFYPVGRE